MLKNVPEPRHPQKFRQARSKAQISKILPVQTMNDEVRKDWVERIGESVALWPSIRFLFWETGGNENNGNGKCKTTATSACARVVHVPHVVVELRCTLFCVSNCTYTSILRVTLTLYGILVCTLYCECCRAKIKATSMMCAALLEETFYWLTNG